MLLFSRKFTSQSGSTRAPAPRRWMAGPWSPRPARTRSTRPAGGRTTRPASSSPTTMRTAGSRSTRPARTCPAAARTTRPTSTKPARTRPRRRGTGLVPLGSSAWLPQASRPFPPLLARKNSSIFM